VVGCLDYATNKARIFLIISLFSSPKTWYKALKYAAIIDSYRGLILLLGREVVSSPERKEGTSL
jgi:hypothetical protein